MAVSRIFENVFYVHLQKHYCSNCLAKLKAISVSKVVNSNSAEANNYDFHSGESFMIGDVKFIWTEFECPRCSLRVKIKDMKKLEREYKRKGK